MFNLKTKPKTSQTINNPETKKDKISLSEIISEL